MKRTPQLKKRKARRKAPRARLTGLSVTQLQKLLWIKREYPEYFRSFKASPELMNIYRILVDKPKTWQDNLQYWPDPAEKLHLVFGTDYRHIFSYRAVEQFKLEFGELSFPTKLPSDQTVNSAREVYPGYLILVRYDTRDEDMKIELQILSNGLLQDSSEDYKVFNMDTVDFPKIRKYLKLIDSDGVTHEIFEQNIA